MAIESLDIMDEFSGLPFPIDPVYAENRPTRYRKDRHHCWHDELDPLLQGLGGKALRESRVQLTNYDAHHLDYHGAGLRPLLPIADAERLRPVVFAAADYVPPLAIAFGSDRRPYLTRLELETRLELITTGTIYMPNPRLVRRYLCDRVLAQDLSDLSSAAIDEFLCTSDKRRKWELGNDFLGRASRQVAEPVDQAYREAYKQGLIPRQRGQTASRVVLGSLGLRRRRTDLFAELATRLAA